MATIATTTNTTPFQFPANTLLDRNPLTGHLYAMVKGSTANTYDLYRSTNGGTSWALYLSLTRASVAEIGSLFIGNDGWLYWCYRTNESSQDRIYARRIDLSLATPGWEGEFLLANPGNGGVAGAVYTGLDIMVVISPATHTWIVVAAGYTSGAQHGVQLHGLSIASIGYFSDNAMFANGVRSWLVTGSGRITPSIDIEHNSDGKTSAAPHLRITFGRTTVRQVKMAWNGVGWTGSATGQVTIAASITAADSLPGRWDGTRYLMASRNNAQADTVALYERDKANSTTTTRVTPTHPTGNIRNVGLSYNATTRDTRVYAVGTSTTVLYFIDYIRATGLWSAWGTVLATAVLGTNGDNWGARRGSYGDAKHHVYTAHTGAPNTLTETIQSLSYAPNTPTWASPATGAAQDTAAALLLDWDFSDPDPADTQSAYAVRRQVGAGALNYWRASDSTWQVAEVKNVSATSAITLASGWGAGTDANHTYAVKVWDSADTASIYSAGVIVVPSVKVNPAFTAPAAAAVITTDHVTISWTAAEQTAYRLTLKTNPGAVLMWDSNWVQSTATTVVPDFVLADLTGWTIGLTTKNNEGLASTEQTRNFTVDYIEPMTPTLVVTAIPASGVIRTVVTNPAPSGGAPALAYQDLYRRVVGATDDGLRVAAGVASGATVDDWRAVSGVAYQYRSYAVGVNGTSIYSAWTS